MNALGWGVGLLSLYVALVFFGNRWNRPAMGNIELSSPGDLPPAGSELSISTWNIGYSALGARADFIVDGGRHLRVLTRAEIEAASERIGEQLSGFGSDVLLLQENAGSSFLTRGVSVRSGLDERLNNHGTCFWSDFSTVFVPKPLRINHGMSVYNRVDVRSCSVVELPQDPSYYLGMLKKYYGGLVSRIPIENDEAEWVVINIHLSAFDESAKVRQQQVSALFEFAQAEFARGNYVVIGGDWNMKILETDFPHQTKDEFLFWIHDFPQEILPADWTIAADPNVPTVRTLHKSYRHGENYTMIIDGFAVSPNVDIVSVEAMDFGFKDTDHHPVSAQFRTKAD